MAQNNTTRDGAWDATVGPATAAYNSGLVLNAGYTRDYEADAGGYEYYRQAWWRYRPITSGSVSVSASGSVPGSGATIRLFIFQVFDFNLSPVDIVTQATVHTMTVAAGDEYYFIIAQDIDTVDSNYWLNVSGQLTAKPSNDEAFYKTTVIAASSARPFEAAPTPTDQLTTTAADPNGSGTLLRDAWWKITLGATGDVIWSPRRISGTGTAKLMLYTYNPTANTYDYFDECAVGSTLTSSGLPTGFRLYAQLCSSANDATATYRLSITAPRAVEPNNHQYDDAKLVDFSFGGYYLDYVDTSTLNAVETPPPGLGAGIQGSRGAWYKLRPATTGVYTSQAEGSTTTPATYLGLYQLTPAGVWSTIEVKNVGNGGKLYDRKLAVGNSYYWRTSDATAGSQENIITITPLPKATHHQYVNALPVESDAPMEQESLFITPDFDVTDLVGAPETNPPGVALSGNCGIWYTIVPATSKNGAQNPFDVAAFSNDGIGASGQLQMWSQVGPTWTLIKASTAVAMSDTAGPTLSAMSITQGTRYYIRFSSTGTPNTVRLRFRYFPPPGVEGVVSVNNHQATDAITIVPDGSGNWSETHSNVGYDAVEVMPPGTLEWGSQAMWWKYTPTVNAAAGTVEFSAASEQYGHTVLIYDSTSDPWVEVDFVLSDTPSFPDSTHNSPALTGGVTYYYRVANYEMVTPPAGSGQTMRLALTGGGTPTPPDTIAVCPPIEATTWLVTPRAPEPVAVVTPITVSTSLIAPIDYVINGVPPIIARVSGGVPTSVDPPIAVPAITVHVGLPIGNNLLGTPMPAIPVKLRIPAPGTTDASIFLSNPDPGQVVANFFPTFVVGLSALDDYAVYQIQIEYGDDPTFAGTNVSVTLDAPVVDGGVSYTPATPVPTWTYWHARLLQNGVEVAPWTAMQAFLVQEVIVPANLPILWTVSAVAERPIHLWHFVPDGVEDGDEVVIIGQGFPMSPGTLDINGLPITPTAWTLIPANPAATPDQRYIDGDVVDAEHFAVTFIAPNVEEPGGPITVGA